MFYQLPPVGNAVRLAAGLDDNSLIQDIFSPYTPRFFNSGTAALAASIQAAVSLKAVAAPEVILPAYGCPDLVSAIVFAGAKPVLVDLAPGRPWLDLEQVATHMTANTVAVIAASLCGVPERLVALRQITEVSDVLLIEDSAQLFPGSPAETDWQGDLVVISFGRGKPVSLLGGGAVLFRDDRLSSLLPATAMPSANLRQQLAFQFKARLYNLLIHPRSYWILQSLPFLHLGETVFKKLDEIAPLDRVRAHFLAGNIASYQSRNLSAQTRLSALLDSLQPGSLVDLPKACGMTGQQRLLRYPLLLEPERRDQLFARMSNAGLGVSMMYQQTLQSITGLKTQLSGQGPFPVAELFAQQLLTLPVHAGVCAADIEKIAAEIY